MTLARQTRRMGKEEKKRKKHKHKKSSKHKKHSSSKHHKRRHSSSSSDSSYSSSDESVGPIGCSMPAPLGPQLPPSAAAAKIGPPSPPPRSNFDIPLPPHLQQQQQSENEATKDPAEISLEEIEEKARIAVAEQDQPKKRRVGPAMPSAAELAMAATLPIPPEPEESKPKAVPAQDSDEDDDLGPRPEGQKEHAAFEIEARRQAWLESQQKDEDTEKQRREDWMMTLPEERKKRTMDMTNRTFSAKELTSRGDTSMWTDTPADRQRKALEKARGKVGPSAAPPPPPSSMVNPVEEASAALVEQYNSLVRPTRLIDMHQQSLAAKPAEAPQGIQSFDRDRDLLQRQADPKRTKEMIVRSHDLNSRFASGSR